MYINIINLLLILKKKILNCLSKINSKIKPYNLNKKNNKLYICIEKIFLFLLYIVIIYFILILLNYFVLIKFLHFNIKNPLFNNKYLFYLITASLFYFSDSFKISKKYFTLILFFIIIFYTMYISFNYVPKILNFGNYNSTLYINNKYICQYYHVIKNLKTKNKNICFITGKILLKTSNNYIIKINFETFVIPKKYVLMEIK